MSFLPEDPASPTRPGPAGERRAEPRRVFLETYGCQMNVADSELVRGLLARDGWEVVPDPALADAILVNTCAIRENAEERVLGRFTQLLQHKQARPGVQLGLLGCVATHQRERLLDRAPWIDLVVGPDGYRDLPALLAGGTDPRIEVRLDRDETYADLAPDLAPGPRAFLTVMRGCDKFCTFCVVPFTRGRERSLPAEAVLEQVRAAVRGGKREVILLGQTVNAWRHEGLDFGDLLRRVASVPGLERVRFTSPHPSDVGESMIDAMAGEEKVMPWLHLPLQSASDAVLAAMQRGYGLDEYRRLLDRVRARVPGLAVSTDVIVGFPGENESDFGATERFLREARYDFAYLFKYSAREGTRAWKMDETVDEAEKGRRLERLIALQESISLERHREQVGREVEVLVEGPSKRPPGHVHGKTRDFKTAVFSGEGIRAGDLVRVLVEDATAHTLLAAPARAAGRAPVPPDGSGDGRSQPTSPGGATPA